MKNIWNKKFGKILIKIKTYIKSINSVVLILKIKKRYYLKKKKVKEIKKELGDYGSFIGNKDTLELLESEDYDSIAGHMIHELGHIPTEGEYIDINGIRFTVMKMDKHRVADIDIRLPEAETEQSPSEH